MTGDLIARGVWLNGERIDGPMRPLRSGDVLLGYDPKTSIREFASPVGIFRGEWQREQRVRAIASVLWMLP